MTKKVSVGILGHRAWIEDVKGFKSNAIWKPVDSIGVMLRFEEAVETISTFYISLPVIRYTLEEFLGAVHREGNKTLKGMLERDRKILEDRALEENRQASLDQKASEIRALVGLD